jgi:RNA polymerase-binding transcription factor DksA
MRSTEAGTDHRTVKQRLHERRWSIMAQYPVWDDDWIKGLTDHDARLLLAIFEAMRRVDRGLYGICVRCGTPIDVERLSALPEAAVCSVCEVFAEHAASAATVH